MQLGPFYTTRAVNSVIVRCNIYTDAFRLLLCIDFGTSFPYRLNYAGLRALAACNASRVRSPMMPPLAFCQRGE